MTRKITRISDGPVGDRIWWFGQYERIRRVPADYSSSGNIEYWCDWLPTPNIYFSRYQQFATWKQARWAMANPIDSQIAA